MSTATSAPSSATAEAEAKDVPRRSLHIDGVEAALSSPVTVCQGYDSVIGTGLSTAMEGKSQTVGAQSDVTYTACETIQTLSRALQVDQSLSVGFGPFGGVDQKMTFIYKLDVTTTSLSIVVYARHVIGKEVLTEYALKPNVPPPAGDEELRRFFRGYGDSFLTSVTRGGEYYAVYTFYSQTKTEQASLAADMKAKGIWSTGNLDASLQVKLDQFIKTTTTRVSFKQTVSGIENPNLPTPDKIIEYAINFPKMRMDKPAIVAFETLGYERVPAIPDFQPIVKNRTYFTGRLGTDSGLTKDLVTLQQLSNQAKWIEGVYRFYGGYRDEELNRVAALAKADTDAIDDQIEAFEADPIKTFTLPNLSALGFGTPKLEIHLMKSAWGSTTGGSPFDDVDPRTAVQRKTWLSAVQLRTGAVVDRLITVYENEDLERRVYSHGGDGGRLTDELKLLPGQFPVKVTGRAGKVVDRLDVLLPDGRSVAGGGPGGTAFQWDIGKGDLFLLGFAGRSGTRLDQIAVVYASFKPASWTPF